MEIKREVLIDDMPGLYAVGNVYLSDGHYYVAASENRGGKVFLVNAGTRKAYPIEGGAGGVMAALDLKGEDAIFSVEEFYPVFDSRTAKIIKINLTKENDGFSAKRTRLADVPYVHRVAQIFEEDGVYLAAGRLCTNKEFKDDWSTSGPLEIAPYDRDMTSLEFEQVYPGIFKHHAMFVKKNDRGFDDLYFGGTEGAFCARRVDGKWKVEQLLSVPTSDIVVADLDGDGEDEIAIIEEFHGNQTTVFKKSGSAFERALELPMEFGHVLWGGTFLGRPGMIVGCRGGEKKLTLYRLKNTPAGLKVSEETVIDEGQAPAQIIVNESSGSAEIVAANHGMAQLVRYQCCE